MNIPPRIGSLAVVLVVALVGLTAEGRGQGQPAQEKLASLAGAWTLNRNPTAGQSRASGGRGDGRESGERSGNLRTSGDFGGGPLGGGAGGVFGRGNPELIARQREALRDITDPPDHLVVTVTESMVILTAPDGRTTRLAPDGTKVRDENTKIERRTRWSAGKLVSEIDGLGQKITQTFSVDSESHQLRVLVEMEKDRYNNARSITHVYDADAR